MIDLKSTYSRVEMDILRPILQEHQRYISDDKNAILFAVLLDGVVCGYAVTFISQEPILLIKDLYITPMLRDIGLGTNFLQFILSEIQDEFGDINININFDTRYDVDKVQHFFDKNKFSKCYYDSTTYKLSIDLLKTEVEPIFEILSSNLDSIKKVNFEELNSLQKERIEKISMTEKLPLFLQPFKNIHSNDTLLNCYYFTEEDEAVGWCLATIADSEVLEMSSIYIVPSFRTQFVGFLAFLQTFRRAEQLELKLKLIIFGYDKRNKKLHRFYKNLFGKCIIEEFDNYVITKF